MDIQKTLQEIESNLSGFDINARAASASVHRPQTAVTASEAQGQNIRVSNVTVKYGDPDLSASFETFECLQPETNPMADSCSAGKSEKNLKKVVAKTQQHKYVPHKPKSFALPSCCKSRPSSLDLGIMNDLIQHYKHSMLNSDDEDSKDEEKLHILQPRKETFKEPNLNVVLPSRNTPQSSRQSTLNNSLISFFSPTPNLPQISKLDVADNLGAPYFKLNGAIVDDESELSVSKITSDTVTKRLLKDLNNADILKP